MIELLFNIVLIIIGIYVSIFTWITKKDIAVSYTHLTLPTKRIV